MRVLVIEDNEHRRKFFHEFLKDNDIEMVATVAEALRYLNSSKYDLIYLDHDLANHDLGIEVARKVQSTLNAETKVIVHSMNIAKAKEIVKILPSALIQPFIELYRKSLASILCLFETEQAKEDFLQLCRDYYGERVKQESGEQAKLSVQNSRRAEIHNQIMEIVEKLSLYSEIPMPSPSQVESMIMNYFESSTET